MNFVSCESPYDSASSRTHPPQAGAALKSSRTGRCSDFALLKAASTLCIQLTAMEYLPLYVTMFM
jgi:hypothetical protein